MAKCVTFLVYCEDSGTSFLVRLFGADDLVCSLNYEVKEKRKERCVGYILPGSIYSSCGYSHV